MTTVLQVFSLFGALAMFLYGMTLMSEGLQKSAGDRLRSFMASMTSNAFKRVLTGAAVTALVQSSSATTIMVVSFVNAGLLTLGNAIGVIMGANIGTTLTAWITSLGFSVDIALFAVPMMAIGFVMASLKKDSIKNIGQFFMGFSVMFVGLTFMKDFSNAILGTYQPQMLTFFGLINHFGFGSVILFLLAGAILTIILQASSATMAITMLLASTGLIDFPLAVAMVLGENIGTTITANIAAAVANTSAKRAARAHTVFNVFGVIWVLIFYYPIVKLVGKIMLAFGGVDPMTVEISDQSPDYQAQKNAMLYGIATLHTLFNVTNTVILIWFVPMIEKIAVWMVKAPRGEEEVFRLKYIQGGPLNTAEISLNEAQQEIIHFGQICLNGFKYLRQAVNEQNPDKFDELNKKLIKYEEITDKIEYEIATYLNEISKGDISEEAADKIKSMYKIIGEMESLGDSGEAIGRMLKRKNIHAKMFDDMMLKRLNQMMDLVEEAYEVMIENLKNPYLTDISNAMDAEYNINGFRNDVREEHIVNLESGQYNYLAGVYYMDIASELEKIGDFIINISEAQVIREDY
jgi:phosphate:Na+ symporter